MFSIWGYISVSQPTSKNGGTSQFDFARIRYLVCVCPRSFVRCKPIYVNLLFFCLEINPLPVLSYQFHQNLKVDLEDDEF